MIVSSIVLMMMMMLVGVVVVVVLVAGGGDGDSLRILSDAGFRVGYTSQYLPVMSNKTAKIQPTSFKKNRTNGKCYCKGHKIDTEETKKQNRNQLPAEPRKIIAGEHLGPLHPDYIPMAP